VSQDTEKLFLTVALRDGLLAEEIEDCLLHFQDLVSCVGLLQVLSDHLVEPLRVYVLES